VDRTLAGRFAVRYKELVCKGALWGVANPTLGIPVRRRRVVADHVASEGTARVAA
jgi:hypothetical protein